MASNPVSNTTAEDPYVRANRESVEAFERENRQPEATAPAYERDKDGRIILPIITCPKCGAQAVAFICDTKGCPVNGGAAYG